MAEIKTVLAWSGGKDSAMALHSLRRNPMYRVVGLLTTVSQRYDRVSHHGVRSELIQRQADAAGLPLKKIMLSDEGGCSCINQRYEDLMREATLAYMAEGVEATAFGDIFLEGLRRRRESKLAQVGMRAVLRPNDLVGSYDVQPDATIGRLPELLPLLDGWLAEG